MAYAPGTAAASVSTTVPSDTSAELSSSFRKPCPPSEVGWSTFS
jgi:hypothetical protein